MLKRLGRTNLVQALLGYGFATYLRLLRRTTRFTLLPPDIYTHIERDTPFILAMWHGQHLMLPLMRRKVDPVACLLSKHGTAEINTRAIRHLGLEAVRGSGAEEGKKERQRKKGGAQALRQMMKALADGFIMALTADIPKTRRVAGKGIVLLAKHSGRPIRPGAVVFGRRIDLDTWDRASLGLPFGRGVIALGEAIHVPPDASQEAMEEARRAVEAGLDALHEAAYRLVGSADPGQMSRADAAQPSAEPREVSRMPS